MLFDTQEKIITVGNDSIGKVELKSLRYITFEESEWTENYLKKLEPLIEKVNNYCNNSSRKVKLPEGDILDSFYYNTTNSKEIRKKLIELDKEELKEIIKIVQKITDINSVINMYMILLFRTSPEIKTEIEKFQPTDLLVNGKVLTSALLIQIKDFYEAEFEGIAYIPKEDENKSENFTS